MQTAISTIHTFLFTILTLAQYHDSVAKDATLGIILDKDRLKENVTAHKLFVSFITLIDAFPYLSMKSLFQAKQSAKWKSYIIT